MKKLYILALCVLFVSSCGNVEQNPNEEIDIVKIPENSEISPEENLMGEDFAHAEDTASEISPEEEALLESLTELRESYDEACVNKSEDFFRENAAEIPYEVQTVYRKSDSNHCIVAYYYLNDSGIHSYTIYDLEDETVLDEVSCEPEYDVENDSMSYCEGEKLDSLKLEYTALLEKNL